MRRVIISAVLAGASLLPLAPYSQAATYPGGTEGCTVAKAGEKCTYDATRNGGYAGTSSGWKVTIVRAGKTIVYSDKGFKGQCTTAVLAKDKVTVESTGGQMAAGNPFPTASDGKLPPTSSEKPGTACKK